MAYIPHTQTERKEMLAAVGVAGLDALFEAVPAEVRFPDLDLPEGISEMEAMEELTELSEANVDTRHVACFLGAGAYNHFIPSAVDHILRRGEFYTAYTPYQPEISQGTLQSIFEYQSLICNLTGMDVSNASHYDGATALAEAVILALTHHRGSRRKIVLSPFIHPQYRQVVRTYIQGMDVEVVGDESLSGSSADLAQHLDDRTAMVAVQYPDFLGHVKDFTELGAQVHAAGRCSVWRSIRWRWGCSSHRRRSMPISSSGMASRWGSRCPTAVRAWVTSPSSRRSCARWPDGWSARRWTAAVSEVSC